MRPEVKQEPLVRVRALRGFLLRGGKNVAAGEEVELPKFRALELVAMSKAELVAVPAVQKPPVVEALPNTPEAPKRRRSAKE